MNVREKFLELTSKTYPYPHDREVLEFLPELTEDKHGNFYKIIGQSKTVFTAHLDTADQFQKKVNHVFSERNGDEWVGTDGSSILGADDKAGVCVLLYMMEHNIPGIYYFFVGEEVGLVGSGRVSRDFDSIDFLQGVERMISFDRRSTGSIITRQMGRDCCSSEFAQHLISEYDKVGLPMEEDPGGIYTDSAIFMDLIPECTNISVGYNNEHSSREVQNLTFLEKLCEASIKIDWESSPTIRKIHHDVDVFENSEVIDYIESDDKLKSIVDISDDNGMLCLSINIEEKGDDLMAEVEKLLFNLDQMDVENYTEIDRDIFKILIF